MIHSILAGLAISSEGAFASAVKWRAISENSATGTSPSRASVSVSRSVADPPKSGQTFGTLPHSSCFRSVWWCKGRPCGPQMCWVPRNAPICETLAMTHRKPAAGTSSSWKAARIAEVALPGDDILRLRAVIRSALSKSHHRILCPGTTHLPAIAVTAGRGSAACEEKRASEAVRNCLLTDNSMSCKIDYS